MEDAAIAITSGLLDSYQLKRQSHSVLVYRGQNKYGRIMMLNETSNGAIIGHLVILKKSQEYRWVDFAKHARELVGSKSSFFVSRNKVIQLNSASTGVDEIPMSNYSKSLNVTIEGLFLILRLIQKLIFAQRC